MPHRLDARRNEKISSKKNRKSELETYQRKSGSRQKCSLFYGDKRRRLKGELIFVGSTRIEHFIANIDFWEKAVTFDNLPKLGKKQQDGHNHGIEG